MPEAKRYGATVDFYVYANSDDEAVKFLDTLMQEMQERFDNSPHAKKLLELPFGSLIFREVQIP